MLRRQNFALAFTLAAISVCAQDPAGTLRGSIQDESGARIPSATIAIESLATASRRTVYCDEQGKFLASGLVPGIYKVRVAARGFAEASSEISIAVSSNRDITVTLRPHSVKQTIGVESAGSTIAEQPMDGASQAHQSIITRADIESLPLASRSFANIAYLAPGTEPVEPSDPTKARITAVSTGGSSGLNNELSVDGGDNSDDYIGGFLQNYSPDAIQEFSVRTSQEDADTGSTTAGSVVISTRSGTNQWRGDAAFYERSSVLNARFPIENPAPNPKQPFSRQNYVGTFGGPVKQNKLWSFTSFEQVHENASIAYSSASLAQFQALASLAAGGLIPRVSSIAVQQTIPVPFRDFLESERFDWDPYAASSWFLRAATDTYTTHNDLVEQGTLPSTGLLTHNNYFDFVLGNRYIFSPSWIGRAVLSASALHLTQTRNSNLGFALAFPFSSTALTVSGYETFGDNQFATPITFFPSERNQQKYQLRYDLNGAVKGHAPEFGINLIHEPVLGGSFPGNTETLYHFPQDPTFYVNAPAQFTADMQAGASSSYLGGGFAQNIQRLAFYGQDSWRIGRWLTVNYGMRASMTWGLFNSSGRSQVQNPGILTLQALDIPLVQDAPHDDRHQIAPRLGVAWLPRRDANTVVRAGIGIYMNDLAQSGWAAAFQAVNTPPENCVDPAANPADPANAGCVPGSAAGGTANLIDPRYRTPYAIHISAGVQRTFGQHWSLSVDYTHEQGNHAYRAYSYTGGVNLFTPLLNRDDPGQSVVVPNVNVFHSDNRSSYNALMFHFQGNATGRVSLVANYTLSKAQTWGCLLGELFDYVNGVCNPQEPFGPGDYGPSGEDVRHRAVLAGVWHAPGNVDLSTLAQAESARPFTITTADNSGRISVNGVPTSLDQFRGTPYIQADMRISRPIRFGERWLIVPFAEMFNVFNRDNPGANYVTNIAQLPVPPAQALSGNITEICSDTSCSTTVPLTSLNQLRVKSGALGDFFGPGTTVGIPFAAQYGVRVEF